MDTIASEGFIGLLVGAVNLLILILLTLLVNKKKNYKSLELRFNSLYSCWLIKSISCRARWIDSLRMIRVWNGVAC